MELILKTHSMLVAFNVTQLEKWGYNSSTIFIDPMEPEFRPKGINEEDYTEEAIRNKLDWFYSLNAYNQRSDEYIE
jgi:bilirubin oxidase